MGTGPAALHPTPPRPGAAPPRPRVPPPPLGSELDLPCLFIFFCRHILMPSLQVPSYTLKDSRRASPSSILSYTAGLGPGRQERPGTPGTAGMACTKLLASHCESAAYGCPPTSGTEQIHQMQTQWPMSPDTEISCGPKTQNVPKVFARLTQSRKTSSKCKNSFLILTSADLA